jgi:hypothetical protein
MKDDKWKMVNGKWKLAAIGLERASPPEAMLSPGSYTAGLMFRFSRKKLVGSYFFLISASRA